MKKKAVISINFLAFAALLICLCAVVYSGINEASSNKKVASSKENCKSNNEAITTNQFVAFRILQLL